MPDVRPLRIVHMAATPSGAPWMVELLREQRRRGYDVSAVIAPGEGNLAGVLDAERIPYLLFDFNVFSGGGLASGARRLWKLSRLLVSLRADIVQTHLFPSIVLGRLASWLADVPLRFSMIPGPYYLECPILSDIEAGTAWADTKVIASCERTRTLYVEKGVPRGHLELVYYGVDPARFDPGTADRARVRRELGLDEDTLAVGMVAYFYPTLPDSPYTPERFIGRGVKGHDVLLAAIPEVRRRFPNAVFLLVGKGWGSDGEAHEKDMRALAEKLGVSDRVRFVGERNDVADVLAAFDVSLQCSRSENLGGSIESLLMARPLIVTNVGGLVDSVHHEMTGLVVPPDDPAALAEAIARLLANPSLAARLGNAGRAYMLERFSLTRAADDLDDLYARSLFALRLDADLPRERRSRAWATPFRALLLGVRAGRLAWRARRAKEETVRRRAAAAAAPRPSADRKERASVTLVVGAAVGCAWLPEHARELKARGWDVRAVIDEAPGPLAGQLRAAGIPVRTMRLFVGRTPLRALAWAVHIPLASCRLARLLRDDRADVVHAHLFTCILITRLATLQVRGARHVAMIPSPRHLEALATRWADRLTWRADDVTVAGCAFTRDLYLRLGRKGERLETIYYGVDAERFRPLRERADVRRELGIDPDAEVVGHVAHFYPPMRGVQVPARTRGVDLKGREHLLAAARLVVRERPRAVFILVGGGWGDAGEAYRRSLMSACANDSLLSGRVIFTGNRNDVPDVLAAMDVAVQCALTENLGGTLEALLLERPVVATRVGGMPESVRHEETGLLVPPANPPALASAITRLLSDPLQAARYGQAGRRLVLARFTLGRTADDLDALYARVCRRRPGAVPEAA